MNSVLTYLTEFVLLLPKYFINEVILVEINQIIKGPPIEFGELLCFIGIWMLIKSNPVTNRLDYFIDTPVDTFGRCLIF